MIIVERPFEIKLSLVLLVSFFLHSIIGVSVIIYSMPELSEIFNIAKKLNDSPLAGRDIIVNINQDDKSVISKHTLLSDKDSSARGYITTEKGNRFLNNSLNFKLIKGVRSPKVQKRTEKKSKKEERFLLGDSEVVVMLEKELPEQIQKESGNSGIADKLLIPDKNDVTRNNAIFYSSSGTFSFNTAKFKNFHYFKAMKDKIAANWHPPLLANVNIGGYAPGVIRLRAIPSQEVKIYFSLNREGEVVDVQVLDSYRNKQLDDSCIDAIKLSKNFGKVPENLKGEIVVIPFIFGYYIY